MRQIKIFVCHFEDEEGETEKKVNEWFKAQEGKIKPIQTYQSFQPINGCYIVISIVYDTI